MWSFISRYREKWKQVGAVCPSSDQLAEAITCKIPDKEASANKDASVSEPVHYLEVGAGTGSFTEYLVKNKLKKGDILDAIEVDHDFCEILRKKFKNFPQVHIIEKSITDWNPDYTYKFIVSGLPFNSLPASLVKEVLAKYAQLIEKGGVISYFEYIGIASIREIFLRMISLFKDEKETNEYQKFLEIRKIVDEFTQKNVFEETSVFLNVPPARVFYLKF